MSRCQGEDVGFSGAQAQRRIREANGKATQIVPRLQGQHWAPAIGKYDYVFLYFK